MYVYGVNTPIKEQKLSYWIKQDNIAYTKYILNIKTQVS